MMELTEDEKSLLIQFRGTPTFKLLQKIVDDKRTIYGIKALMSKDILEVREFSGFIQGSEYLLDIVNHAKEYSKE
jgi:hypothetical protein